MEYTGTIIGMKSSFGSIYHVVVDDAKCYIWKANVIAGFTEKMFIIRFNWNGDYYEIKLGLLKENYYSGNVFWQNEICGNSYFWMFRRSEDIILKGDFKEDERSYDCFIELKPLDVTKV